MTQLQTALTYLHFDFMQIQDQVLLLDVKQTLFFGHFCAKHLKLYYSRDLSSFAENCLSILLWHNQLHLKGAKLETKPMTWLCFLCELQAAVLFSFFPDHPLLRPGMPIATHYGLTRHIFNIWKDQRYGFQALQKYLDYVFGGFQRNKILSLKSCFQDSTTFYVFLSAFLSADTSANKI